MAQVNWAEVRHHGDRLVPFSDSTVPRESVPDVLSKVNAAIMLLSSLISGIAHQWSIATPLRRELVA
jgi:hypothetical protein